MIRVFNDTYSAKPQVSRHLVHAVRSRFYFLAEGTSFEVLHASVDTRDGALSSPESSDSSLR